MKEVVKFTPALGYKLLTRYYDFAIQVFMPENKFRSKLMELLDPWDEEEILEFGFGTAQNLLLATQLNNKTSISGLDIDPDVYALAMEKVNAYNTGITLDLYQGGSFPYPDNSFDKVFSSLVFHQLDRDTKLHSLREAYRVMQPGGRLLIGDWGKARSRIMRLAFLLVQLLDGFKTTRDNVEGRLPEFIREAGFSEVREVTYINTILGTFSYYTAVKA